MSTFGRVGSFVGLLGGPVGGLIAVLITWARGDTQGLFTVTLIFFAAGTALGFLAWACAIRPRLELRPDGTILVRGPMHENSIALTDVVDVQPGRVGMSITLRNASEVTVFAVQTSPLAEWWLEEPRGYTVARELLVARDAVVPS